MRIRTRPILAIIAGMLLVGLLVAAGCGSNNSSTTPSPSPTAASTQAQITANWEKFFNGATPAADKIALVQDGQQFAETIQAQAKSPLAQSSGASVMSIKLTSPNTATVTYAITVGGQTAMPGLKGQAVLVNGTWLVSAKSFKQLLKLEAGQTGASPSSSP
jgi:uncharacterized protein YceK